MAKSQQQQRVGQIVRQASRATFRLRANDAIDALSRWLPLTLAYAAVAGAVIKFATPGPGIQRALVLIFVLVAVAVLGTALYAFLKRRPAELGALALDRFHDLGGRVSSALEFRRLASNAQTPLMMAAISDALAYSDKLNARRAVPLRAPRRSWYSVALGALVVGVALLELPHKEPEPLPAATFTPFVMQADDLELVRAMGETLNAESRDPEVAAAARRFNQLVEDIANSRIDRQQVFSRLEELERQLVNLDTDLNEALDEGLKGIAQELKQNAQTKPIADALEQKSLKDAEEALRELAKKLKNKGAGNKSELEKIRKALESASKANQGRIDRINQARKEIEEQQQRLLQKKQAGENLKQPEQEQLDRQGRRLERLDRQKKRAEAASKELSKLDRELAEAARKLMEEMGASAQHLEGGAEDLNRMNQEQMSRKEKEDLKQRLEELRSLLRQQGKGGDSRAQQMQRFAQRARGGKPGGPSRSGQGPKGPAELRLGNGGEGIPIPMPMPGGSGEGKPGDGSGNSPGQAQASERNVGSGTDSELTGAKTDLAGRTQDVAAAGIDSGQGPSASAVVYGAAERGFAGRGYRDVYTEYQTEAEQAIEKDQVPAGYEFYVRRYFQLIRPRD